MQESVIQTFITQVRSAATELYELALSHPVLPEDGDRSTLTQFRTEIENWAQALHGAWLDELPTEDWDSIRAVLRAWPGDLRVHPRTGTTYVDPAHAEPPSPAHLAAPEGATEVLCSLLGPLPEHLNPRRHTEFLESLDDLDADGTAEWAHVREPLSQLLFVLRVQALGVVQWAQVRLRDLEDTALPMIELTADRLLPYNNRCVLVRLAGCERKQEVTATHADCLEQLAANGEASTNPSAMMGNSDKALLHRITELRPFVRGSGSGNTRTYSLDSYMADRIVIG